MNDPILCHTSCKHTPQPEGVKMRYSITGPTRTLRRCLSRLHETFQASICTAISPTIYQLQDDIAKLSASLCRSWYAEHCSL